jgi:lipopolysaccharide/colanic/teichoic acid biosynthesis glycosyltransferase
MQDALNHPKLSRRVLVEEHGLIRVFDVAICILSLLTLLPVFGLIAIAIKLTSPGPVFYRAKRVGQHGQIFYLYKFRTMYVCMSMRIVEGRA